MSNTMIKDIILANATEYKKRIDCPKCGGVLTLSITKEGGKVKYNCYRACCKVANVITVNRTKEEIYTKVSNIPMEKARPFKVPDRLVQGFGTLEGTEWARENNVIQAYEDRLTDLAYDPRLDRLCFYLRDKDKNIVGMVGRYLGNAKSQLKWWIYPDSLKQTPFICGKGSTLILVEDAASACSVARVKDCVGMALLGTNFHGGYIKYLKGYSEYIICLDNDAKRKACNELYHRIKLLTGKPVAIMFTKEDPKRLPLGNLETMVNMAR